MSRWAGSPARGVRRAQSDDRTVDGVTEAVDGVTGAISGALGGT